MIDGLQKPRTTAADRDRAVEIENLLMYLGLYERKFGCPNPMFFDGAMPTYGDMFRRVIDFVGHGNGDIDTAATHLKSIEGCLVCSGSSQEEYDLVGCRPMSFADRQRLLKLGDPFFVSPDGDRLSFSLTPLTPMLQIRSVRVFPDGSAANKGVAYWADPDHEQKWKMVTSGPMIDGQSRLGDLGYSVGVALAEATRRSWFVGLRFAPDCPGLRFITDPTGIREFFKFRDIPEGKSRRAALANWVTDHWRIKRNDPEAEVYVRAHLRGDRTFSWHGMSGEIHFSEVDAAKAVDAVIRRKRMPAAEAMRRLKTK